MLAAQSMYGPDDRASAAELAGALAVGRNLWRLTAQDDLDRQPLAGRRWTLVADVRLDDPAGLAAELGLPTTAQPLRDAELMLAAIERWGEDAPGRLYGDFALAAFDRERRRLILARDPAGLKPLFFHRGAGLFAFASMPKGLHALAELPRAPDLGFMARAMTLLASQGAATFFEGVERVEPGGQTVVTADAVASKRWWSPQRPALGLKRTDDYAEACRAEFDRAVAARLRGVGAAAAHLSGGFDSAAVAATAARVLADRGGRVVAYTAAPREGYAEAAPDPGRIVDESGLAASVAALYPNIEHVIVRAGAASPVSGFDRGYFVNDWPTANPSNAVWARAIEEDARRRGLSVLLTGDMGNITLSYHGLQRLPELLRQGRLSALIHEWGALNRRAGWRWRALAAITFGPFVPGPLWERLALYARGRPAGPLVYSALRPQVLAAIEPELRAAHPNYNARPWADGFAARLWTLARADHGPFAKGTLAGAGVDQRDPTADRRFVEFCLALPMEAFLKDGVTRRLAKAALADRLPAELLHERRRGLQAADWHEGFLGDLAGAREELARIAASREAASIVDVERLGALLADLPQSEWKDRTAGQDYRLALLRGLSAGHFVRRASGSNA